MARKNSASPARNCANAFSARIRMSEFERNPAKRSARGANEEVIDIICVASKYLRSTRKDSDKKSDFLINPFGRQPHLALESTD